MIKIRKSDTVSGEFFLKFLNTYKEYDKKQKEYINLLKKENEELQEKIKAMEEVEHCYEFDKCKSRIKNYKILINNLVKKNENLKEEIKTLQNKTSVSW